ncbi:hypothetical protein Tco_0204615 [Tanacetum coccineum]
MESIPRSSGYGILIINLRGILVKSRHGYAVSSLLDTAYWMSGTIFFKYHRLSSKLRAFELNLHQVLRNHCKTKYKRFSINSFNNYIKWVRKLGINDTNNMTLFDVIKLKKIPMDKMTQSKSYQIDDIQKRLYDALVDAYGSDKCLFNTYGETILLKRNREDEDDQTSNGSQSSKKTSTLKGSSKGKSPATSSKSVKSAKEHEEDLGKSKEQPTAEVVPKNDWFKKFRGDPSPDPEWNVDKIVDDGPQENWLNDLAKAIKSPLTFNELMHNPIDFSAFAMNRL